MTQDERRVILAEALARHADEYDQHATNARALLAEAKDPCDGEHECEEDHGDEPCDCPPCTCRTPAECRGEARTHALLAQAAAQMAQVASSALDTLDKI